MEESLMLAVLCWGCTGRRLASMSGAPLRKLLELVQEAAALIDCCCKPGVPPSSRHAACLPIKTHRLQRI